MSQIIIKEDGKWDFGLGDLQSKLILTEKICPRCGRKCLFPDDGEPGLSPHKAAGKLAWYKENLFRGEWVCKVCCRLNNVEDLEPAPRPPEIKVKVEITETSAVVCQNKTEKVMVFDEKFCGFELEYEVFNHELMMRFVATDDKDALLGVEGSRWLSKGGSVLESSISGAGKSVARLQRALSYALGLSAFGVSPVNGKRLKSLIMQAENDFGDEAEIFQGVVNGLLRTYGAAQGLTVEDILKAAQENIIVCRISASGDVFAQVLDLMIKMHAPDIVWVDPMFPYWGKALSDLGAFTEFTRNRIAPILARHKTALWLTHHFEKTGKGFFGPSDLQNWVRACVEITKCEADPEVFCFNYTKRGERSGVPDRKYHARHSAEGLFWEPAAAPAALSAPAARRLPAPAINKEAEAAKKEADELRRALSLVKVGSEFEVKELLGKLRAEFGCAQRKAEYLWQLMKEKSNICDFVQIVPGKYRCEEAKAF